MGRIAHLNRHGDLAGLHTPSGHVSDTRVWDPYGNLAGATGLTGPDIGFQADWTDPVSGEVWMGARHYQPVNATFTARDTVSGELGTPISLNRHTYANANPLSYFDPDGRAAVQVHGGGRTYSNSTTTHEDSEQRNFRRAARSNRRDAAVRGASGSRDRVARHRAAALRSNGVAASLATTSRVGPLIPSTAQSSVMDARLATNRRSRANERALLYALEQVRQGAAYTARALQGKVYARSGAGPDVLVYWDGTLAAYSVDGSPFIAPEAIPHARRQDMLLSLMQDPMYARVLADCAHCFEEQLSDFQDFDWGFNWAPAESQRMLMESQLAIVGIRLAGIGGARNAQTPSASTPARGTARLADDAASTGGTASTSWGRTIDDFQHHGDQWRRVSAHAEGATGRAYRGGTSMEEVFGRGSDRLIRHRIYGPSGDILHETFLPYAKYGAP